MAENQSRAGSPDPGRDVTASEVADYAYCAKAWHLQHVLGKEPSRHATVRQKAGVTAHEAHGIAVRKLAWLERRATNLIAGLLLLAVALLALDRAAPGLAAASTRLFPAPPGLLALFLGFFAGFLLYIGTADILPEAHSRKRPAAALVLMGLTCLGAAFIFVVVRVAG